VLCLTRGTPTNSFARPSGQHQQQQVVLLRVQRPGFGAYRFLARRILLRGAQVQGGGDPALEQRMGARSLRLMLQAEGEANPPMGATGWALLLHSKNQPPGTR